MSSEHLEIHLAAYRYNRHISDYEPITIFFQSSLEFQNVSTFSIIDVDNLSRSDEATHMIV